MQLKKIRKISGAIRLITGLHIGGNKDSIEIGGMDQPIIKHPLSKEPYIPGSSLKGKMRSLLETFYFINHPETPETKDYVTGKKDKHGNGIPCGCGKKGCLVCTIFGTSSATKAADLGPTRIIVRDSILTKKWKEKFDNSDLPMEEKYENSIHRVKGTAADPRPLERVPAGVEFDFNISFKQFEGDDDSLIDWIYKGLKMIELDAIGGSTSRGSGQVKFENLTVDGTPLDLDTVTL